MNKLSHKTIIKTSKRHRVTRRERMRTLAIKSLFDLFVFVMIFWLLTVVVLFNFF